MTNQKMSSQDKDISTDTISKGSIKVGETTLAADDIKKLQYLMQTDYTKGDKASQNRAFPHGRKSLNSERRQASCLK